MIKIFRDLAVYQRSKKLYLPVMEATNSFPHSGKALADQLRRSTNSIHANIAEGFGRSDKEFKQYLTRALGSNNETLSHLEDAHMLRFLSEEIYCELLNEYTILGKQLFTLRKNWQTRK